MKWLYFILSHSIFIAVCAVSLVFQTALLLHIHLPLALYGFIFFATIGGYNTYWLLSKYGFNRNLSVLQLIREETGHVIILGIAWIGIILFYAQHIIHFKVILPAVLLIILYSLPLLPVKLFKIIRKPGFLKTTLLAFTWSYVTVIIPLGKSLIDINNTEYFLLSRRFLFMLMLCIIFDSRDIQMDKIRGLHSLATDVTAKTLKWIIFCIFALLFATNFLSNQFGLTFTQSLSLQISTIALLLVYFLSTKKRGYLFYYFLVDGMMLFSSLLTYFATIYLFC